VALDAAGLHLPARQADLGDLRCREDGLGHDAFVGGHPVAFERVVSGETTFVRGHGGELAVAGGIPRCVDVRHRRTQIARHLETEVTHLETKAFGSERFGPPLTANGQARLVRRDLARLYRLG